MATSEARTWWNPSILSFATFVMVLFILCEGQSKAASFELVWEKRLPLQQVNRLGVPFFSESGQLLWGSPTAAANSCVWPQGESSGKVEQIPLMKNPDVIEIGCISGSQKKRVLVGVDQAGREIWRHPLLFHSGSHEFKEHVVGYGPNAIVLDNLTVISGTSGKVIFSAPLTETSTTNRPIPKYGIYDSVLFLPQQRRFLVFNTPGGAFDRKGGLFMLEPSTGNQSLVQPIRSKILGGHWNIVDMQSSTDGAYIFASERLEQRGLSGIALSALSQDGRTLIARKILVKNSFVGSPRIAVDPHGNVGIAYEDQSISKLVLQQYRLRGVPRPGK